MEHIMRNLVAVQRLQLNAKPVTPEQTIEIQSLRRDIPAPILAHFDRLIARGKTGVALAHAGVCTACHLKLSTATTASLADPTEIHLCDNCGRYIYQPEARTSEPSSSHSDKAALSSQAKPAPRRSRKASLSHVAPSP